MYKVHAPEGAPHQYGEANHAEVTDGGHLLLFTSSENPRAVVAVYHSGSWVYAENPKPEAN